MKVSFSPVTDSWTKLGREFVRSDLPIKIVDVFDSKNDQWPCVRNATTNIGPIAQSQIDVLRTDGEG